MTLQEKAVTVVLPTYNHARFLPSALDSLIAQTRPADRVIVVNDGSTDDTAAVLDRYVARLPNLTVVHADINQGVIAALNRGLEMTDSEFVTFLAADDTFAPRLLEAVVPLMCRHPAAALCGVGVAVVDERGRTIDHFSVATDFGETPGFISRERVLTHLSACGRLFHGNGTTYRTAALRHSGGFDPELRSFCDGYLIQKLALETGACHHPEVLARWLVRQEGYARSSLADAVVCLAILQRVAARTQGPDAACFPPAYRKRLLHRLGYWGVLAATLSPQQSPEVTQDIFMILSSWGIKVFLLAGKIGKRWLVTATAAVLLRPWDILPALARRARTFSQPPKHGGNT